MDQVDPQAVGAAPAEEFDNGVFCREVGQETLFFAVQHRSQAGTQQEPAQTRQQGEVVTGGKARGRQTQGEQPAHGNCDGPEPPAQQDEAHAQRGPGPPGQPPQGGPQHHAHAQQVQDAEIDDDEHIRHVQQVHARRDHGDDHAAAEHLHAPAEAVPADGGAQAGQNHKAHAAVVHGKLEHGIFDEIDAQKVIQVKAQVDEHHAEDHHAPQGVQLPDSVGFCHGITSL